MNRQIYNKTITVDGVDIFYREAGDRKNPSLLLLHGFPTSSVMFKNLMVALAENYHLIAPITLALDSALSLTKMTSNTLLKM